MTILAHAKQSPWRFLLDFVYIYMPWISSLKTYGHQLSRTGVNDIKRAFVQVRCVCIHRHIHIHNSTCTYTYVHVCKH